jgi:hypothetical protein
MEAAMDRNARRDRIAGEIDRAAERRARRALFWNSDRGQMILVGALVVVLLVAARLGGLLGN